MNFKKLLRTSFLVLVFSVISLQAFSLNYYWVGGSGNWSDQAHHWATTSGGSTFQPQVPSQFDNVIFDANSFTAAGQTVNQDVHGYCKNMDWSAVTNNPTYNANNWEIHVYGSLTFASGMSFNHSGILYMESTGSGNTLNTAGKTMQEVNFIGQSTSTGEWTLQSNLTTRGKLYFYAGKFISNGYDIKCQIFESYYNTTKNLNFTGTNTIEVQTEWRLYPNGAATTFSIGTATIKLITDPGNNYVYQYFYGAGKTYNDVIFTHYNLYYNYPVYIYDSNTFRDVTVNLSGNQTVYFNSTSTIRDLTFNCSTTYNYSGTRPSLNFQTANNTVRNFKTGITGTIMPDINLSSNNTFTSMDLAPGTNLICASGATQTVSNFVLAGTCSRKINIRSTYSGSQATISTPSGTINGNWLSIKDIKAIGGATFNASNSLNFGNNTGWNFLSPLVATTYYWIGNTGDWNDAAHWATTSGGVGGGCNVPTRYDNVVFDANSFTNTGQTVNINIEAECKSMNWTGVTNNPSLNFASNFSDFGSLTLSPSMNLTGSSNFYFESFPSATNTIDLAGKTLPNQYVYFNNNNYTASASWILNSNFSATNYVYFQGGVFTSNSYDLSAFAFIAGSGRPQNINFAGTTSINISYQWQMSVPSGSSFNIGSATINYTNNYYYNYFYGGNQTYNDIIIDNNYSSTGYIYFNGNNTIRDLKFKHGGTPTVTFNDNSSFRDVTLDFIRMTPSTDRPSINYNGQNTFNSLTAKLTGAVDPILILNQNNTFGTLAIDGGYDVRIASATTQTVNTTLNLTGNCRKYISLSSNTAGSFGTIKKTSGIVNADYVKLKDTKAIGGATFNVNHAIDQGNVTGWNIVSIPPANYYWVGGTGNWSDPIHWSTSSGGSSGGCNVPSYQDNVFFDVNSFNGTNQTVTVDVNGECKSMSWNGVTGTPRFSGTGDLKIFGSLSLDPSMVVNYSGRLNFESPIAGNTINTLQHQFNNIYFNGSNSATAEWTMQSQLKSNNIYFTKGTLNSAGSDVTCTLFQATGGTLNFIGNGTINCAYYWYVSSGANLNMDHYTIKMVYTYYQYFYGGNKTYYNLQITNTYGNYQINIYDNNRYNDVQVNLNYNQTVNFTGSSTFNDVNFNLTNNASGNAIINFNSTNTFNDVSFTSTGNYGPYCYFNSNNTFSSLTFAGVGTRIYLGSNATQTVGKSLALGSGGFPVFLQSTTAGTQATISQATGQVCLDFVWLKDIKATGGASFNAGASSTDIGNNTGWTFSSCSAYYWVGGTGNWSDLNHWATTSGGTFKQVSLPTANDDVYFDGNSFSAINQTVNIDVADPRFKNMSWLSSLYNPTMAGSSTQVNIYGSLYLISSMNVTFAGDFNFKSNLAGTEINTAGKTIKNLNLIGSGEWTLKNILNVSNEIKQSNGSFITNSKDITTKYFTIESANTRTLNLGSSKITVNNGGWNMANTANLTFVKGTSEIVITGTGGNSNFYGNGITYYNASFITPTTLNSSITGANTFNVLKFDAGLIATLEPVVQKTSNLIITGNCSRNVTIKSSSAGVQSEFNQNSGTVTAKFVNLSDNKTSGGATFKANLSTNSGNVSGWNFSNQPVLSANLITTIAHCQNFNDGSAKVQIIAGTPPFSYKWSTNEVTDSIGGLIPGNYSVIVSDSVGCKDTLTFAISGMPLPTIVASGNSFVCPGSTLSFTASGGVSNNWSGPNGFASSSQNPTIVNVTSAATGVYTVQGTGTNGCYSKATVTVSTIDNIPPTVVTQTVILTLNANGSATLTPSQVDNGSTDNCSIASMSLDKTVFGCADTASGGVVIPITYIGTASQETQSHGGGYNPNTNEFWYPQWSGTTIYKYNSAHSFIGTINAPTQQNMQLWMDKSSSDYYTATWGYQTINRISGNTVVWSYNIGSTAACVATSNQYVYGQVIGSNVVVVLNKATGAFIKNITLPGSMNSYGGMAYANGKLYFAGYASGFSTIPNSYNAIHIFDATTGAYISSVSTVQTAYNMAFDGETMWLSPNSNTIYGYKISNGNSYGASGSGNVVVLTVTDAAGNSATGNAVVKVINSAALPTASSNSALCPGGTLNLSATGGNTYSWSGPNGFTSTSQNPTIANVTNAATGIYTVVASGINGCNSMVTTSVNTTDNTAPTVVTQSVVLTLDANGYATLSPSQVNNGSTDNCSIASMSLNKTTFSCADTTSGGAAITPTYIGSAYQDTYSHGGGYNPNTNEFWYPQWAGTTIYKHNSSHALIGSFNAPTQQNMQLWMDKSSSDYYTATWSYNTINRISGNTVVWSYNLGYYAQCVTTDNQYVYAMQYTANQIVVLNKTTGAFVKNITLPGSIYTYGGLVYANGKFYIAGQASGWSTIPNNWQAIHVIDAVTGNYINSVSIVDYPWNTAFDGETMWISSNSSTIYGYKISNGNAYGGSGSGNVTLTVTDASGNSGTGTVLVKVVNNIAPEITCQGDITINASSQCTAAVVSYTTPIGTHNCGGVTTVRTAGLASGSVFPLGTTVITHKATAINGQTVSCSFNVNVIAPEINVNGNSISIVDGDNTPSSTDHTDFGGTVPGTPLTKTYTIENTGTADLSVSNISLSGTSASNYTVSGMTFPQIIATNSSATFDVTFSASSPAIYNAFVVISNSDCNESSYDFAVKSEITCTIPVFTTCPATISENTTDSTCNSIVNYTPVVTGVPTPALSYTISGVTTGNGIGTGSGTIFNKGISIVTIKAANSCGSATCTFSVLVNDNTAPIAICKNKTVQLDAYGQASITVNDINNGSSDNCGIASIVINKSTFNCSNVGANNVVLTITDVNNNVSTCTAIVTVVDGIAPVVLTNNVTVNLDATGNGAITVAQINNGSSDACGIANLDLDKTTFNCSNVGTNTVTLTATDVNGNVSSNTAIVTVVDAIAPIVLTNNVTVNLDASGNGAITVAQINNGSSDACGIANLDLDKLTFNCSNVGTNTVTLTAIDVNGNVSSNTAVVTVVDAIAPVVLTNNVTVNLDATGNGAITVAQINNGSSDACGIANLDLDKTTFNCSNVGTNTVTLTAIDVNGNVSSNTAVVTVVDAIAPVVLTNNVTVNLDATGNGAITVAQINNGSSDACGIANLDLDKTTFNCSNVGTNTVTLTAIDVNGNISSNTAVVTVVDAIAPVVLTNNVTINLDATGNAAITVAQINNGSSDACGIANLDLDKTTFNCSNVGTNTVTLTAIDVNGNISSNTAVVTVVDAIAPVVLTNNVTINLDATGNAAITVAQINNGSSDACGIANLDLDKLTFNCTNVGTNTVTLTATDVNGNVSSNTAVVTVVDGIAPVVLTNNVTVNLDATGNGAITVAQINNGSSDACGIASLTLDNTNFNCSNVGTNTVTLTAIDVNGNVSSNTAVVTVVDAIAPVVLTNNVTVNLDATGNGAITVAQINNGSSDACGIASLDLDKTTFNCSNVGTNTVTLTATDVNGNVSSNTAVVTVVDGIAPVVLTNNVTVNLDATGNVAITVAQINNGSSDACGIASLDLDKTTFNCSNVGTNTVTLTATDVNGNVSSNTAVVTVVDAIAPVVLTNNVTVNLDAAGNGAITVAQINNGSSDACGIASLVLNKLTFNCANIGANTVTLTATDVNGNISSNTAIVTVKDMIAPIVSCKNLTVTIASGSASITAAQINNGSTDNCGIKSITIAPSTFNCSNIGLNTVTLTVTDNSENVSTCQSNVTVNGVVPTCSIKATTTGCSNEYTGGVITNLYLGYGADNLNLTTTATGAGPFTYSWTGTALSVTTGSVVNFKPTHAGLYTITCTTKNSYGCTTSCSIVICVKDIRVPNQCGKVYICHVPPGNPGNPQTLSISKNAVSAHIGKHAGDALGSCNMTCGANSKTGDVGEIFSGETTMGEVNLIVSPNPSADLFNFKLETESDELVNIKIYDMAGRVLLTQNKLSPKDVITVGAELAVGVYMAEITQGEFIKTVRIVKMN